MKILAEAKGGNYLLPVSESTIALCVCMELAEPRTFHEAWNHPDPEQCMKRREAIRKEFADTNKQQVWKKVKQEGIVSNANWSSRSKGMESSALAWWHVDTAKFLGLISQRIIH